MNGPAPDLTMVEFMTDPNFIGVDPVQFRSWLTLWRAAGGLPPEPGDLQLFTECTGRKRWPEHAAKIVIIIVSRRGMKTSNAGMLACFEALKTHRLVVGEWGTVVIVCPSKQQARLAEDFTSGYFHAAPYLQSLVVSDIRDTIELSNKTRVMILASDYKTSRGFACPLVILDEACFFATEGSKSDEEVVRSFLPSLATMNGTLVVMSSPHGRWGWVYDQREANWGRDDLGDDILCWQAGSSVMNPSISQAAVEMACRLDPGGAKSEWLGEFREDISPLFGPHAIENSINRGVTELPYVDGLKYFSFVDSAGGGEDAFTLAIGHVEGEKVVQDVLRSRRGMSPYEVVKEYAVLLKQYHVNETVGDRYSAQWCSEAFEKQGVHYRPSELSKSELYLEATPRFNAGHVCILDNKELRHQLQLLERKTNPGGKDSIDHPRGGHDDSSNVTAGLVWLAFGKGEPGLIKFCRTWREKLQSEATELTKGNSIYRGGQFSGPEAKERSEALRLKILSTYRH